MNRVSFEKKKIQSIKGFNVVGKRCYIHVLFEDGYEGSFNAFETTSAGTVKDSCIDVVIPEGKYMVTFKVSKPGFGNHYLGRLSLKMLEA